MNLVFGNKGTKYAAMKDEAQAILTEATPCDGCWQAERCRSEALACTAFAYYASNMSPARWKTAPRDPTRERFKALFG